MQSHKLYRATEDKCTSIANIITKLGKSAWSLTIVVPALLPISYAIFGYPPPQKWILTLETQYVPFH